jgi:hypothetical protein
VVPDIGLPSDLALQKQNESFIALVRLRQKLAAEWPCSAKAK